MSSRMLPQSTRTGFLTGVIEFASRRGIAWRSILSPAFPGRKGGNRLASREEKSFPERPKIRFYASSRDQLPISDAGTIYRKLAGTRFPTLYSSTNPEEDFADSLANYVHVIIQEKPYRVEVLKGEMVIQANEHCWNEPRCASKKKFFDALIPKAASPAE